LTFLAQEIAIFNDNSYIYRLIEAKKSGVKTRKQDGLEKILMGYTDLTQTRTL